MLDGVTSDLYETCVEMWRFRVVRRRINEKLKIMINLYDVIKENIQEHNLKWSSISDHFWYVYFRTRPKNFEGCYTHFFILKISNRWKLEQIAINDLFDLTLKTLEKFLQKLYCKNIFIFIHWCYSSIIKCLTFFERICREKYRE